jgi:hypothetical protein
MARSPDSCWRWESRFWNSAATATCARPADNECGQGAGKVEWARWFGSGAAVGDRTRSTRAAPAQRAWKKRVWRW